MRKASSFEFLGEVSFDGLNDLMCSVAVLLFISGVSACASAHDFLLSVRDMSEILQRDQLNFFYRSGVSV